MLVYHFSLDLRKKNYYIVPPDLEAISKLQNTPANWTIEHDEALVRLMAKNMSPENEQLGSIKNYVESIDVSSYIVSDTVSNVVMVTISNFSGEIRAIIDSPFCVSKISI